MVLIGIGKPGIVLPQVRGLFDGLEEAGYIDGKNLTVHHLRSESAAELRNRLKELVRQKVDVIVASSASEATIAQQVTREIPIVFAPSIDPVRMGFVKSRSRPDTNLTGLSYTRHHADNGKQLAVFKEIVPGLRRVTLFYDARPAIGTPESIRASVRRVAQHLNIQLIEHAVTSSADAVKVLQPMSKGAIDGAFLICTAVFRGLKPLADSAAQIGVPLFGCTAAQVADEGALMTYTPDIYLLGYRGAWYIDRILKGAKPDQLPVEAPSQLQLVINLKNAKAIGLKIPPERLILADRVFQ
ncbi:MAG: ABC transporter substrate-binding protein [Candidatus Binatia bacterium]